MIATKLINTFAGVLILLLFLSTVSFAEKTADHLEKTTQDINQITVKQLASLLKNRQANIQFSLIDTRSGKSYIQGHIPGAISIYDREFDKHMDKLPEDKDQLIVYYCDGTS
jgi:hypothetical protein